MIDKRLTAVIQREENKYVAMCLEVDIASEGDTIESARANLVEALELFFEVEQPEENERGPREEPFITTVRVAVG